MKELAQAPGYTVVAGSNTAKHFHTHVTQSTKKEQNVFKISKTLFLKYFPNSFSAVESNLQRVDVHAGPVGYLLFVAPYGNSTQRVPTTTMPTVYLIGGLLRKVDSNDFRRAPSKLVLMAGSLQFKGIT